MLLLEDLGYQSFVSDELWPYSYWLTSQLRFCSHLCTGYTNNGMFLLTYRWVQWRICICWCIQKPRWLSSSSSALRIFPVQQGNNIIKFDIIQHFLTKIYILRCNINYITANCITTTTNIINIVRVLFL